MTAPRAVSEPVVMRRVFQASRSRVFAAWTTPELLARWFGPSSVTILDAHVDLREGGDYRISMRHADGEHVVLAGTFTSVRAPESLIYTWKIEDDVEPETRVSIEFIERGDDTEIFLTHDGFVNDDWRAAHARGWNVSFERFQSVVAALQ